MNRVNGSPPSLSKLAQPKEPLRALRDPSELLGQLDRRDSTLTQSAAAAPTIRALCHDLQQGLAVLDLLAVRMQDADAPGTDGRVGADLVALRTEISNLREIVRQQIRPWRTVTDLRQVVRCAWDQMQVLHPGRVTLSPGGPVLLAVDPVLVYRGMCALLREFCEQSPPAPITVSVTSSAARAVLQVRGNRRSGPPRLAGLGFAVATLVAVEHGGDLEVGADGTARWSLPIPERS